MAEQAKAEAAAVAKPARGKAAVMRQEAAAARQELLAAEQAAPAAAKQPPLSTASAALKRRKSWVQVGTWQRTKWNVATSQVARTTESSNQW